MGKRIAEEIGDWKFEPILRLPLNPLRPWCGSLTCILRVLSLASPFDRTDAADQLRYHVRILHNAFGTSTSREGIVSHVRTVWAITCHDLYYGRQTASVGQISDMHFICELTWALYA
jgi:hypothetical protein